MLGKTVVLALLSGLAAAGVTAPRPPVEGLRLVKTSENDKGTWMTEDQKDALTGKHVNFVDITETFDLEMMRVSRVNSPSVARAVFPAGPSHQTEARPIISALRQSNIDSLAKTMTDQFSRNYKSSYAKASADWMLSAVRSAASGNSKIAVRAYTHTSWNQNSVIATIPGVKKDTVIVSAHFDSTAGSTTARAPGADDNASGCVVLLEALRAIAAAKFAPQNTLEFHFYAAEEGGLLGSRAIMQEYARTRVPVRAVVNQDMTGYSPNNVIAVYTDYVDAGLTKFVQTLVPAYTGLPLSTDRCGYGCSDHASARDAGFPAAYVCDENMRDSSPYIHSSRDTYSTLSIPHMLEHAKLTVGFLVEGAYF